MGATEKKNQKHRTLQLLQTPPRTGTRAQENAKQSTAAHRHTTGILKRTGMELDAETQGKKKKDESIENK